MPSLSHIQEHYAVIFITTHLVILTRMNEYNGTLRMDTKNNLTEGITEYKNLCRTSSAAQHLVIYVEYP